MNDLKIRVISQLSTTQQVLLYEPSSQTNGKSFFAAAWEHPFIAPKAQFDVVLPMSISVSAASNIGNGKMSTRQLSADYNSTWEIRNNDETLDVRTSAACEAAAESIEPRTEPGKIKLCVALSDMEIHSESLDAATRSANPLEIDCEGQGYVTIRLHENAETGLVSMTYDFTEFD